MKRRVRFWAAMMVFQVVFGVAVFTVTREYYKANSEAVGESVADRLQRSLESPGPISNLDPALIESLSSLQPVSEDPAEIARLANQFFADGQYAMAATQYERVLAFDSNHVDTLNNLGLTLHYLGRSDEALGRINEGIALDPGYQRIWLTLGFINGQMGNTADARAALTTATEIDPSSSVGLSAATMLEGLQ